MSNGYQEDSSVYETYNSDESPSYEVIDPSTTYQEPIATGPSSSSKTPSSHIGGYGAQGTVRPFPSLPLQFNSIFKWHSWEGEAVARPLFYLSILTLVFHFSVAVAYSAGFGSGAEFLTIVIGIIGFVLSPLFFRLMLELCLSVFAIRDDSAVLSQRRAPTSAV